MGNEGFRATIVVDDGMIVVLIAGRVDLSVAERLRQLLAGFAGRIIVDLDRVVAGDRIVLDVVREAMDDGLAVAMRNVGPDLLPAVMRAGIAVQEGHVLIA